MAGTIKYCDFVNGDDDNGDGTYSNPYKTITKASTGLGSGDEVRVAKSPAPVDLTVTFSFTNNSKTVTASDSVFINEVTAGQDDTSVRRGDFIKGGDGNWWEVVTINSATSADLYQKYSGSTQSGVSSQKLMVTSTGEASGSTTAVQTVSSSGTSASTLKISGGWNLSNQTQDGQTYFRQLHSTFNNRYGYGLYASGKSYVEISRLHFLRYNYGIYLYSSSNNNTITTPTCNSNSAYGIYLYSSSNNNTITSPTCNSSNNSGIYLSSSSNNTITTPTCNSNNYGIYLYSSSNNNTITTPTCNSNNYGIYIHSSSNNNTITTPTCNSNSAFGIYIASGSNNNTIKTPTCNSNNYGIYIASGSNNNTITTPTCNSNNNGIRSGNSSNNIVNNYSGTSNTSGDIYVLQAQHYGEYPCLLMQHFKEAGDNRCYYEYGVTYRDTTNPRGGTGECLKFSPTSTTYYISQSFYFAADSGVSKTISAYIRKDASLGGDVQGAIFFMGEKITGWTDITPTEDNTYEQKSLVANAADITEDGVLELRIKVRGSSGKNVYVDDISIE